MNLCPKCNAILHYLNKEAIATGSAKIIEYQEELQDEEYLSETVISCPKCGAILFTNMTEASLFLNAI